MLATMSNGYSPQLEQHHSDQLADHVGLEERICPGCKNSAVSEQGGLVVAFGQSFFHVDCFKCAKCSNQVTADTNLLLLSDGSPICANCSYSCNICKQPILDEAIMTGDDSYHAHCFKCKVCKNRIDELVFAKTSQGIYCMDCHNERMIKIRKHNEKKAAAAAAAAAGGSVSSRHRTRDTLAEGVDVRSPSKRPPGSYVNDAFVPSAPPSPNYPGSHRVAPQSLATSPLAGSFPPSVTVAPPQHATVFQPPPRDSSFTASEQTRRPHVHQNTLPSPSPPLPTEIDPGRDRRKSYDDGMRPLDRLLPPNREPPQSMGRSERRRSINPGLVLDALKTSSPPPASSSPTLSPSAAHFNRSPTPPSANTGRDSPKITSPLRDYFPQDVPSGSRPTSGSSLHSLPRSEDQTIVVQHRTPSQALSPRDSHHLAPSSPTTSSGSAPHSTSPPDQQRRSSSASTNVHDQSSRRSRPPSNGDVPIGVESGPDDIDGEVFDNPPHSRTLSMESVPPAPPPKEPYSQQRPPYNTATSYESVSDADPESSQADSSDDMSESSPVEERSHATFIAPALPPIRFSMDTSQFSELFTSQSSAKLAPIQERAHPPTTPPPSASSFMTNGSVSTNRSDGTVIAPSQTDMDAADDDESTLGSVNQTSLDIDSASTLHSSNQSTRVTITAPGSHHARPIRLAEVDPVLERLQEALDDARERGAHQLKLDRGFIEAILASVDSKQQELVNIKNKFDGMKRASKSYIDGLTVAQTEYDRELKARRDAEAEVTRLRVLLSGQAARLTAMSGDSRRQELRQQMTKDLHDNMSGLEHDLSKLKVQRDMALAEVEELSATKSSPQAADPPTLGRSLTVRLDKLKTQYQRELVPLTEQREALQREILELKGVRDVFLEETTVLNARNEELAQLSNVYARRMDASPSEPPSRPEPATPQRYEDLRPPASIPAKPDQGYDEGPDARGFRMHKEPDMPTPSKGGKFMKWGSRSKEPLAPSGGSTASSETPKKPPHTEHNFQQLSVLRLTRCDQCGDKMWGSQLRCSVCNLSIHTRCLPHVQTLCQHQHGHDDSIPLPPSMFGRDLVEQVRADARGEHRQVPVIVEKCIEAVEAIALDYEGIYRKTGGSGQSRTITQLFERGDYDAFDLLDTDRFNDICSVTSVLKTYFRNLPNPLLTFELHDQFMGAMTLKDTAAKNRSMLDLVNKLPKEHYYTLKMLMVHLHRVFELSDSNLMNARNLGVVFGPTLMRSSNPGAEFADMAGKALSIEWLVENTPLVFGQN